MASPETLSTFKLAVAMRRAAPRIEAHYQYFETGVEAALEGSGEVCAEWVIFDNRRYCSPSLEDARGHLTGNSCVTPLRNILVHELTIADSQSRTLPFDRELGHGAAVNLYADVTLPAFGQFHRFLAEKARKGEITYRLRYKRSKGHSSEPLPVAGYGVELALKKTDYIVIDDREAAPKESSGSQAVLSADSVLDGEEAVADLKPLSTSELLELGLKSASFIMQSEKPFETLIKLTQDFPKYSGSIAAHEVSSKFLAEHSANRAALAPSGVNVLWANGLQLIERQIESFTLVDILRRERKLINGVRELGLSGREAVALLGHREVTSAKTEDEQQRFDWRDELEEGQVILWLNNLELDERYADFPSNLYSVSQLPEGAGCNESSTDMGSCCNGHTLAKSRPFGGTSSTLLCRPTLQMLPTWLWSLISCSRSSNAGCRFASVSFHSRPRRGPPTRPRWSTTLPKTTA